MRKVRNYVLFGLILVCAAVCAVLLLVTPESRKELPLFWIAWAFAVPVNLLFAIIIHLWSGKKDSDDIIHMPLAYFLIIVFGVFYIGVAFVFIFKPFTDPTILIVVEIILTVIYILLAMYFTFGADYITSSQKYTKQKVLFIRLLKTDVDNCILKTQNINVKNALEKFSENIRFSDPMSHPSLVGIESELTLIVSELNAKIDSASEQDLLELINKGEARLETRNSRCIMLK